MMIKAEQLLDQIRGIETFIDSGRIPEALGALNGIRHLLMSAREEGEVDSKPVRSLDDATLAALIAKLRTKEKHLTGAAINGGPGWAQFERGLTCWGWYDVQRDSAGNEYRWCGQETEAGLIVPFREEESAAIVLSVRPLTPEEFGTKTLEINVNGRPVALRLLGAPKDKVRHLIVEPQTVKAGSMVEISLYIKHAIVPVDALLPSSDRRKLSFNLFKVMWLPRV